jgi:hypothetical protein
VRRIHLLRVAEEAQAFAPLLLAAAADGMRVGWLELAEPPALPEPLRAALLAGSARAVAVAEPWTLAARPRRGAPGLRELVRQQFLGCVAVLVRGEVDAPRLAPAGDGSGWHVTVGEEAARRLDTAQLVAALRQPRPFAPAEPMT